MTLKMKRSPAILAGVVLLVASSLLSGCGGGMNAGPGVAADPMKITPSSTTLRAGDSVQFSATITGTTNQGGNWSVNGVAGGNATIGTIDLKGMYKAPLSVPTPNGVTVQATSLRQVGFRQQFGEATKSAADALERESDLPSGGQLFADGGQNFVAGSKVMFGGAPLATTFVSRNQLQATGTSTTAQKGTVQITVENPDPGKSISITALSVQVGSAGKVTVVVIPSVLQVHAGDAFNFRTAVDGAGGATAVKWAINGVANGNATLGTISAGGIYTAPATLPNPNTIQVQATSLVDTTATSSATVTLTNPLPTVTSVLPTTIPVGDFTLVISGQKFVSGAVVSFGGTFLPTTFISATQLIATGTATTAEAGKVQVTVINPDPGSATSNVFALQVGTTSNTVSASAAARLLEQSTWGVTPQSLSHVQAVGLQTFLDEQFAAPSSIYPAPGPNDDMSIVQKRLFTNALTGQDRLRQGGAWGLSQIMVTSAVKVNDPSAFVLWQNMFQNDAFGNFSTLLTDVTFSPHLDMVNNDEPGNGVDPNENYAREVMQLFSVGLAQLNQDGTPQLDGSGNPIPTYTRTPSKASPTRSRDGLIPPSREPPAASATRSATVAR